MTNEQMGMRWTADGKTVSLYTVTARLVILDNQASDLEDQFAQSVNRLLQHAVQALFRVQVSAHFGFELKNG